MVRNILGSFFAFVFASILTVLFVSSALAEKRIALVIGNAKYTHAAELKNPGNDAIAMSAKLEKMGFEIIKGIDLDERSMRGVINDFATKLQTADVALLFYAGHGLQVDGQNYILPVNAELKNEIDLQFQGVAVNFLLRIMESSNRTSIVLLDACRNNPLAEKLARSMTSGRGNTVSSGLARMETGVGTYIGFATSPNSLAMDGDGENSPFTSALLKHIDAKGADIETVMRNVRQDVISETNGYQVPWSSSSLVGNGFQFAAPETTQASSAPQAPAANTNVASVDPSAQTRTVDPVASIIRDQTEAIYWQSIQNSTDIEFFEAYLSQYPNGSFASLARLKMQMLKAAAPQPVAEKPLSPAETPAAPPAQEPAKAVEVPQVAPAETKVAALPPHPEPPAPAQEEIRPDVIASVQSELARIGCLSGKADGKWGDKSRKALQAWAGVKGVQLASLEPDGGLVEQMKADTGRICPLVCDNGFVQADGACVKAASTSKPAVRENRKPRTVVEAPKPQVEQQTVIINPAPKRKLQKNSNRAPSHMPMSTDSDGSQM